MTTSEKQEIIEAVVEALKQESQDITALETITELSGVSLPVVYSDGMLKNYDASLLATKEDVAKKADKATTISGYGITDGVTTTTLQTALASKSDVGHSHTVSDITDISSYYTTIEYVTNQLSGKANKTHEHYITDISNIVASSAEINFLKGAKDNIQGQLDGKVSLMDAGQGVFAKVFGVYNGEEYVEVTAEVEDSVTTISIGSSPVVLDNIAEPKDEYSAVNKNYVDYTTGSLEDLETSSKDNIVSAINELVSRVSALE